MTRLLVVDVAFPQPGQDAASERLLEHLRILRAAGIEILMGATQFEATARARRALEELGVSLIPTGRSPIGLEMPLASVDVAMLCRPNDTLAYALWLRRNAPHVRIVYDTVDVHHVRLERRAAVLGTEEARRLAATHRRVESLLVGASDCVLALHDGDAAAVIALGARDVRVIPLVQDPVDRPVTREGRTDLLCVGLPSHDANVDAVHFLVSDVLPGLRAAGFVGEVRVAGAGWEAAPAPSVGWPEGVVFLGWVPDLTQEHERAIATLLPLRWGGGMKGKVAMAMAHGVPVVTTSIGAEGFPDEAGIVVADDARSMIDGVLRLGRDPQEWERRSAAGRSHVAAHLAPDRVRAALLGAVLGP